MFSNTAGSLQQPVVCVANYVFDSLQQDAFRVTVAQGKAQLEELLCTVTAAGVSPAQLLGPAAGGPELLRFVRCSCKCVHCIVVLVGSDSTLYCDVVSGNSGIATAHDDGSAAVSMRSGSGA